ncbi:hypothetical protein [Kushneria phyllosphaerae]|uniref:hypothetical protein n=1 Tax=Kushneria phyllosphaerae TaxID=2100822 RepID=UPI001058162E|nr:hypothetical protein [Kushneria phyllosphaerae]
MPNTDNQKRGGGAARAAGILCRDPMFGLYLDQRARSKFGADVADGTHNEQDARDWICRACGVESRREIDGSPQARATLRTISDRFSAWKTRKKSAEYGGADARDRSPDH